MNPTNTGDSRSGLLTGIVDRFLSGNHALIFIIMALCMGLAAVMVTPREEDPQIVVPLADIYVSAPGASPGEIEKLVASPLERLLWQIDGVEYVYSMSRRDMAIVTVRFFVGEDREESLIKLHNKISMNRDRVPPIIRGWVIKPVEIDDVPIVTLTLSSPQYDDHALRRVGEEVLARLSEVEDISRTEIVGGRRREIRVEPLPEKLSGYNITLQDLERSLRGADASVTAGTYSRFNRSFTVTGNAFLTSPSQVADLVIGVHAQRPVYLRDVARVIDGPEEVHSYTRMGFSRYAAEDPQTLSMPAVTLALAKKKGTNAVTVSRRILSRMKALEKEVLPHGIRVDVTRNYGKTAQEKVNGLLGSLLFAIATVVVLLALTLGWREAVVVALAVPVSFSLALFVNMLLGYTINRVTLFALILSLGLVVDDPITNVDNIQRHIVGGRHKTPRLATLFAVREVLPPVIMSTIAIIVSFTPLFFITGMMGPYMAPMAANVPVTVIFSTLCALTIVPWMSHLLLKNHPGQKQDKKGDRQKSSFITRIYRRGVDPFLDSRTKRWLLLGTVMLLLAVPLVLVVFRLVPLKMLPFDNKDELQIVIDLPEGTPLEATDGVVRAFEHYLGEQPEIVSFVSYVGQASPIDFNGLVRHYYLRRGGNLADIRINLAEKGDRSRQSHAIGLAMRKDLEALARRHNAVIQIVEMPPGPPVLATLVAEIYGPSDAPYDHLIAAAQHVKDVMAREPFVVDIDDMTETPRDHIDFIVDREKAALHGVSTESIVHTLYTALTGTTPATVHLPGERQPLTIRVVLPRTSRSGVIPLSQLPMKTPAGSIVPLAELVQAVNLPEQQPIYHKNLKRVVYVLGETAGRAPGEAVLDIQKRLADNPAPHGAEVNWAGEGEWKITLRVFRDMGIAFAAAMVGIYILLTLETGSFFMPLLIMMAIPLTLIGAMPGFFFLNLAASGEVGGFMDPVFFTATGMIGMIALGGIVIRNAIVLIDFIQEALRESMPFREAILSSGAIRMRPILLTAATTALGAWPITLDPIFSGLAWTLIFGLVASTLFTLLVIPVAYYALYRRQYGEK
jgi:multidrug efflux pump subunit AcrB